MKIAICGKGGSGKSTVTALLAKAMLAKGLRVVVIDSDESNSGLHRLLGFESPPAPLLDMVGGRQEVKNALPKTGPPLPGQQTGIITHERIRVDDIPGPHVVGSDGLQLVSVGKILHALEGCACPMGVLSREFLRKLDLDGEQIAIVDMEAGLEHFGRGIEAAADEVLTVVDPSFESIQLAVRVRVMASDVGIGNPKAIVNRAPTDAIARKLSGELAERGIDVIGVIPYDQDIFDAGLDGSVVQLGRAARSIDRIVDLLLSRADQS